MSVHYTNNPEWLRPDYAYTRTPGGGYVGYPMGMGDTQPWILHQEPQSRIDRFWQRCARIWNRK